MSILHNWGADEDKPHPLDLNSISNVERSSLAFFFGGVADGRHVLASIIGASKARLALNRAKQRSFGVHITINDIQPFALARILCLFTLLNELSCSKNDPRKAAELKMALLCMWLGVIMPDYSHKWCVSKHIR